MTEPKYIDAEKLKRHYAWWNDESKKIFDEIIDLQPDADVVEVVRCKDCKYWHNNALCCSRDNHYIVNAEVNDYCSYGERKDG